MTASAGCSEASRGEPCAARGRRGAGWWQTRRSAGGADTSGDTQCPAGGEETTESSMVRRGWLSLAERGGGFCSSCSQLAEQGVAGRVLQENRAEMEKKPGKDDVTA